MAHKDPKVDFDSLRAFERADTVPTKPTFKYFLATMKGMTEKERHKYYKEMAIKYHPDKIGPEGEEIMSDLNRAYEQAQNPEEAATSAAREDPNGEHETDESADTAGSGGVGVIQVGEKLSDVFRNLAEQAAGQHMLKTNTWEEVRRTHVIPHTTAAVNFLAEGETRARSATNTAGASSNGKVTCPSCTKQFTQVVDLETHFYEEHQELEKRLREVTPLPKPPIPQGQGGFPAGALSLLAVTTTIVQDAALLSIAQQRPLPTDSAPLPLTDDVRNLTSVGAGPGVFATPSALLEGWKVDSGKKATHPSLPGVQLTTTEGPHNNGEAKCGICKSGLWMFSRHHCRNCGMWVCGDDSKTASALPLIGHVTPVRVCSKCSNKDELAAKVAQACIPQITAKVAHSQAGLSFATHFHSEIDQAAGCNPVLRFAVRNLGKPLAGPTPTIEDLRSATVGVLQRDEWLSLLRARVDSDTFPKSELVAILKDLPSGSALAFEVLTKCAADFKETPVHVLLELSAVQALVPKIVAFIKSGRVPGCEEMLASTPKLPAPIVEALIPIADKQARQTPCQFYQGLLRKGVTKELAFRWLVAKGDRAVQDCCSSTPPMLSEALAIVTSQKKNYRDLEALAQRSSEAAQVVKSYLVATASPDGVAPPRAASVEDVHSMLPQVLAASNSLKERIQMIFAHGFVEENLPLMMTAADAWMQSGFQPSMVLALLDLGGGGTHVVEQQRNISEPVPPTLICTLELALLKVKNNTEQNVDLRLTLAECYLASGKSDSAFSVAGVIFPQIHTASAVAKKRFIDILHAVVEQHEAAQVDSTMPYLKLQVLGLAERLGHPLSSAQSAERRKLTSDKGIRKQQKKVDPPHVLKVKKAAEANEVGALLGLKSVLAPMLAEVYSEEGIEALKEACAAIRQDVPAVDALLLSLRAAESPNVALKHAFESWTGGYALVREFWTYAVSSDRFVKEVVRMLSSTLSTLNKTGNLDSTFLAYNPADFPLPTVTKHQQFYSAPSVIAFARCERATLRSLHSGLKHLQENAASQEAVADHFWEHGMRFIDLLAASPNGSSRMGILLRSAECISASITTWQRMPRPRLCGAKTVLNNLCSLIFSIADREAIPDRVHAAQKILSLMMHTNLTMASSGVKLFDENDAGVITTGVEKLTLLTPMWPVLCLRPLHACDLIYTQSLEAEMFETLLASDQVQTRKLFPIHDREKTYHLLCGAYHEWLRDRMAVPALDEARALAVATQLKSSRWSARDVEANVQLSNVPRDENGFLDPRRRTELKGAGNATLKYHAIHGVKIDRETGALTLDLEHATYGKPGLFNDADIGDIFSRGLVGGIFTLDAPPQWQSFGTEHPGAHPFQQMGFSPSTLQNSVLLAEMMYTDYLLKFFTTGTEVSGKAPFPTRSTAALLSQLPRDMQEVLAPIKEGRSAKAHRFWIQAGKIPVQQGGQGDTTTTFKMGRVEMCVKTQLLRRTPSGDTEDAPIADQRDDSNEAEFARRFSRNYDRVAAEFPVFARLRELYKICGAFERIHRVAEGMREDRRTEMTNLVQPKVQEDIDDLLRRVGTFPEPRPRRDVDELYGKMLSAQGISRSQVRYSQECDAKSNIRSQIREMEAEEQKAEDQAVTHVRDLFNKMSGKSTFDTYDTRRILERRTSSYSAARTIAVEVAEKHYQDAQRACRNISSTGIATSLATPGDMIHEPRGPNSCPWVPAAFGKTVVSDHYRLVHGGVSAVVSFTDARVNPPATSPMRMSTNQLNAQRTVGAAHSDAVRIDNLQVNNARFFAQQQQQTQMMTTMRTQQVQQRANLPALASGGGSCYGGGGAGGGGGWGGGGGSGSGGPPRNPPVHQVLSNYSSVGPTGQRDNNTWVNGKDTGRLNNVQITPANLRQQLICQEATSNPNARVVRHNINPIPNALPAGVQGINKMAANVKTQSGNYEVHWLQHQGRSYDEKIVLTGGYKPNRDPELPGKSTGTYKNTTDLQRERPDPNPERKPNWQNNKFAFGDPFGKQ